ncbi:MAG: hypothetical protein K2Y71_12535 [Xanthobacteraceae bacterium]|nr:hypothetical protein [Xanthobacteraceae bacterium]
MRQVDYQQRVLACARQAETAPNLQARIIWKRMEAFWRKLAMAQADQPREPVSFISSAP